LTQAACGQGSLLSHIQLEERTLMPDHSHWRLTHLELAMPYRDAW